MNGKRNLTVNGWMVGEPSLLRSWRNLERLAGMLEEDRLTTGFYSVKNGNKVCSLEGSQSVEGKVIWIYSVKLCTVSEKKLDGKQSLFAGGKLSEKGKFTGGLPVCGSETEYAGFLLLSSFRQEVSSRKGLRL